MGNFYSVIKQNWLSIHPNSKILILKARSICTVQPCLCSLRGFSGHSAHLALYPGCQNCSLGVICNALSMVYECIYACICVQICICMWVTHPHCSQALLLAGHPPPPCMAFPQRQHHWGSEHGYIQYYLPLTSLVPWEPGEQLFKSRTHLPLTTIAATTTIFTSLGLLGALLSPLPLWNKCGYLFS